MLFLQKPAGQMSGEKIGSAWTKMVTMEVKKIEDESYKIKQWSYLFVLVFFFFSEKQTKLVQMIH